MREKFPPQIKYIVGNEACERFSFYGMKSILVVFMTGHLLMSREETLGVYHNFVSAVYLLPLLGGWLSDRFYGKYKTIFWLSVVYCLGHLTLSVFENTKTGMYWGLGLIALGSGGIKPCVSAFVGDQFTDKNKHMVQRVFDLFYFSINFGSVFSTLLIPYLLATQGPRIAFGIPGVLMAIALVIFVAGKKHYVEMPPTGKTGKPGFLSLLWSATIRVHKMKWKDGFFSTARAVHSADDVEGANAVWGIIKLFATVSVFWALWDQSGSSWVLQAQQMEQTLFGIHIDPAQVQAINPILVMLMIPAFSYGVYPAIERMGFKMTPLRKMSGGMVVAASSFVGVALIQNALDSGVKLNVAWQFIPFFLLTASEVMVSITGLEFAYTQAPRSMKSTIMSIWLLTIAVGNQLDAYFGSKADFLKGAAFFWFFAALMLAVSGIFIFAASRFKEHDYMGVKA